MTLENIGRLVGALLAIAVFALVYRWRPLTMRKQLIIAAIPTVIVVGVFVVWVYLLLTGAIGGDVAYPVPRAN